MIFIVTKKKQNHTAGRAVTLGIGITAVTCLLAASVFHLPREVHRAVEASAFNQTAFVQEETIQTTTLFDSAPTQVVPLGSAFGIKLWTDGIIVASLSEIYTQNGLCCPAEQAGIKAGDYLLSVNGKAVRSNAELANAIGENKGDAITLQVRRDEKCFDVMLTPVWSDGAWKSGMWVRDSAAGIGTLTFYDPESGCFAGLGHGICDMDVGGVMALKSGQPAPITLCGIEKGTPESPGQLQGYFSSHDSLGTLLANNDTGVYGTLTETPKGEVVEVLPRKAVTTGEVELLVTVDQQGAQRYHARIERVSTSAQHTKNFIVRITDERLLALTGGIVQGMSGTPILQNGKLAGAITHVFTDDPTMGYGIFAETMCEQLKLVNNQTDAENAA